MVVSCNKTTSFEDCELAILRSAVDKIEKSKGLQKLRSESIKNIIHIVENFIKESKCICYGGTAINNILPEHDQFYNKDVEFPDYDFYSPNALEHAKQLADIYYHAGFEEVEAKSGVHTGTYKVFVNFIPVADITQMDSNIFSSVKKNSLLIDGILYCPPNFLRMSMYLELSRPKGDVSRWEKVLKRITLLNKHYPLKVPLCSNNHVQRIFDDKTYHSENIFTTLKEIFIKEHVVFFGAMANRLYSQHMPSHIRENVEKIPDFDVLSENPQHTSEVVKAKLQESGIKKVTIQKHKHVGELVAEHYEIIVGKDTVAFIYEPLSCHSYNIITIKKQKVRIATIDTMLSFYLAFLYSKRPYFNTDRILCMCQYLFIVQEKNRLNQKGLLKRFTMSCIGTQNTIEDIRAQKSELFNQLKANRNSNEFEKHFLKYSPMEHIVVKSKKTRKRVKSKSKSKSTSTLKSKSRKNTSIVSKLLSWLI